MSLDIPFEISSLKIKRLEGNDLPLPKYQSNGATAFDLQACLTRPAYIIENNYNYSAELAERKKEGFKSKRITIAKFTDKPSRRTLTVGPYFSGEVKIKEGDVKTCTFDELLGSGYYNYLQDSSSQKLNKISDLCACIEPYETVLISTGFAVSLPNGTSLDFDNRSSMGLRNIVLGNCTAVIDPDYRGELFVCLYNRSMGVNILVEHGDRICQATLRNNSIRAIFTECSELDETARGSGGFGSTN